VTAGFDLDKSWALDPQVALRPERFGALAYHFGTRRLSFLKSPTLLALVQSLGEHPTGREAIEAAGVPDGELPAYEAALERLACTGMIRRERAR
jgi:putative mycofactocin binding protein MftB